NWRPFLYEGNALPTELNQRFLQRINYTRTRKAVQLNARLFLFRVDYISYWQLFHKNQISV
ncbi:hypothetical protein, partial [Lactobacillus apis]|uniref:hypothetical protein n=1 Tax=Lactobacillus apis TaxID=303541 RepID=UPI00242E1EDE